MKNITVVFDWKFIAALCFGAAGIIVAKKLTPEQAKEVSIAAVDACKEIGAEMLTD